MPSAARPAAYELRLQSASLGDDMVTGGTDCAGTLASYLTPPLPALADPSLLVQVPRGVAFTVSVLGKM